jgi:hypothetical protein
MIDELRLLTLAPLDRRPDSAPHVLNGLRQVVVGVDDVDVSPVSR